MSPYLIRVTDDPMANARLKFGITQGKCKLYKVEVRQFSPRWNRNGLPSAEQPLVERQHESIPTREEPRGRSGQGRTHRVFASVRVAHTRQGEL